MKKHFEGGLVVAVCALASVIYLSQSPVQGQTVSGGQAEASAKASGPYKENAREFTLNPSEIPVPAQEGYKLFRQRCGECHSLNRLRAKSDKSPDEWADVMYRMKDMASSHMNEAETKAIIAFAVWDDQSRRKQDSDKVSVNQQSH